MTKKSLVALAKSEDIQANVTRVFDLMGGVQNVVRKGSTVVLKPNAGHAEPPETSVCTNPEVVRAVIREVKKQSQRKLSLQKQLQSVVIHLNVSKSAVLKLLPTKKE